MFSKPEELIMAVLAGLWVVLTYFVCNHAGMPTDTALLITVLTLLWVMVFFLTWQRYQTRFIWPLFLGLLVACWWPALTWLATKDILLRGSDTGTVILSLPWYAGWSAKLIYATIPVLLGYALKWKLRRRNPMHTQP